MCEENASNMLEFITICRYNINGWCNMIINTLMEQKHISQYRLAQKTGIPYMTLNDICNGKTRLEKCSAETIYKLAKGLNVTMEKLLEPTLIHRPTFDLFRSNVCHALKRLGDFDFIVDELKKDEITTYYEREWFPECFYLLAMVDYISRINNIPLCDKYDNIRQMRLKNVIYPSSLIVLAKAKDDESILEDAKNNSIPEFINFNIVENEVRDVI